MDYEYLNGVYESIIKIVNNYVEKNYYLRGISVSFEVASKLSFALFGYYLVFGEEIFSKINVILDSVQIHECVSKDEMFEEVQTINENTSYSECDVCALTTWDYKFDEKKKFLGAIPHIFYYQGDVCTDVLSIAHELSHSIEGLEAKVVNEDDSFVYIAQSFTTFCLRKETKDFQCEGISFIELVTTSLETRIIQAFMALEPNKINSFLLRDFLIKVQLIDGKNLEKISVSVDLSNLALKDFIDNDVFWGLIKKYFYGNDEAGFKEEFESYGDGLDFDILKRAVMNLYNDRSMQSYLTNSNLVQKQIDIFSKATNYKLDKKILLLV